LQTKQKKNNRASAKHFTSNKLLILYPIFLLQVLKFFNEETLIALLFVLFLRYAYLSGADSIHSFVKDRADSIKNSIKFFSCSRKFLLDKSLEYNKKTSNLSTLVKYTGLFCCTELLLILIETKNSLIFKFSQFVYPKAKLFVSYQLASFHKIKQHMGDNFIDLIAVNFTKRALQSQKTLLSGGKLKKNKLYENKLLKQSLTRFREHKRY
jgi:hypothetical protein